MKHSEFYQNTWKNIFWEAEQDSLANMIAKIYTKSDNGKNLKQSQINTLYYMYDLLKRGFSGFDKRFNTQKSQAETVNEKYIPGWGIEKFGENVNNAIKDYNETYELSIDDKSVFTETEQQNITKRQEEEKRKQEELEKKRLEEEKRKEEEQKRLKEEQRKKEEEEKRKEEERKQKELEETIKKQAEENARLQKENEELKEKQRLYEEEQKRLEQEFEKQEKRKKDISRLIKNGQHSLALMNDSITKEIFGTTDYTNLMEKVIGTFFNYQKTIYKMTTKNGSISIERYNTLFDISDYARILYMLSFRNGISSVQNFVTPLINLLEGDKEHFDTPKKQKIVSRLECKSSELAIKSSNQSDKDNEAPTISLDSSMNRTVESVIFGSDGFSTEGTIMRQQKGQGGLTFKKITTSPQKLALASVASSYADLIDDMTTICSMWKGYYNVSFDAIFLLYLDCVVNNKNPFQHITEGKLKLISQELSKADVNINGLFQNTLEGKLKLITNQ